MEHVQGVGCCHRQLDAVPSRSTTATCCPFTDEETRLGCTWWCHLIAALLILQATRALLNDMHCHSSTSTTTASSASFPSPTGNSCSANAVADRSNRSSAKSTDSSTKSDMASIHCAGFSTCIPSVTLGFLVAFIFRRLDAWQPHFSRLRQAAQSSVQ